MDLTGLLPALLADPAAAEAVSLVPARGELDVVGPAGVRPPLLAALAGARASSGPAGKGRPLVVVTATGRDADELAAALRCYLPEDVVAVLPAWETLPHERLSPRSDTVARRLAVFRRLAHPGQDGPTGPVRVLVLPVRALLQPVVEGLGELEPVAVSVGDRVDLDDLTERLVAAAYQRVDMVEKRGEFAVRGGILDVFPPTDDHPLRVELWGEDVEEIRWFSVADQRSLEVAQHGLWAPPCREILLTDEVRARAASLAERLPGAVDMLDKLAQGIAVEGMESLAPALVERMVPVLDLVPDDALLVVADPERVRRRAHDLVATTEEFLAAAWTSAAAGAATPLDLSAASFASFAEVRALAAVRGLGWWTLSGFTLDADAAVAAGAPGSDAGDAPAAAPVAVDDLASDGRTVVVAARDVERYRGEVARAVADVRALQQQGWRLLLATEGHGPAQRMVEQLKASDVPARLVTGVDDEPEGGVVLVVPAPVGPGFVAEPLHLAVFSEADLTGRAGSSTRDMRRMPSRRRNVVDPLQLRPGDFVVHEQHGVGRFVELVQRTIGTGANAATREYLVIEYASSKRGQPGDRLFVPSDQLDQVTKYVGGEAPTLNRMGGGDWAKTKGRARRAVKEIAAELIRLYSARMATPGHAFGADTPWQRELEDAFAYVETPDQLATIDEVKADMEKSVPMDRLVCGDVGYGKTEIAVRAAFKAVQDGKQVAVLVPTTLLVQQHLDTFSERYSAFPVTVKALSRFQSDKESKEVVAGLADGSVDIVIGTHRLITGEVRFKDLGLVIIDEEQRFGVEHKETLKALRTNVDVLAMSATPIPRTLEMAVTGIREMSTLATPPEERHPVLTFVGAYDEKQISAAVRRELLREGQVFYVHNKVDSIERAASRISELVPEARVAVAHGKMNEHQLERVIVDFWEKRFDVLVCTTIVETGLDISNANTLILERADLLGLSQLHQLRGRVGRGRERAYAYFLYPPEKPLTETAHDRLQTIAANTDLGAGMAVAMKDLEIRGAGNLLGGEQSGHIEGVGFDLYIRMVGEAVASFRGDQPEELPDVTIELPVDAHIPHDYIAHERLRLEAYKKVASAADAAALGEVRAELADRYGAVPAAVDNLFEVAEFRQKVRASGLSDVTAQGRFVRFAPVELAESAQLRLKRLYPGSVLKPATRTVLVPFPTTARIGGRPLHGRELLTWARQFLDAVVLGDVSAAAGAGTSRR
ncbi:transcription-repair coupling factor [Cellulomonas fimi]|uniref:Transcription-repair-coupling factor n=1 Tax=Cellulomonas fimi (strain ATCC 484 / DSM 20113 / JCM 1341 / CCUG 24087 / LMG 16345 / NBRC 15513 / NCIMB 8980 / NCTC 7547 / NRS-133) TaxID=590998 RepID=F4GYN0_CELFA|nr:transcription-repair coupling factor [Cellulomonas fimi]AEE47147.1 transcription-repair coupling factor [Cellulomonas fimi ATCC 484]NNH07716.1 transcription-repair coupling factor [Cellulomonas fimi]VEH35401.1 Transcription-repair-coupling factor [Cellulomonas fimi]